MGAAFCIVFCTIALVYYFTVSMCASVLLSNFTVLICAVGLDLILVTIPTITHFFVEKILTKNCVSGEKNDKYEICATFLHLCVNLCCGATVQLFCICVPLSHSETGCKGYKGNASEESRRSPFEDNLSVKLFYFSKYFLLTFFLKIFTSHFFYFSKYLHKFALSFLF